MLGADAKVLSDIHGNQTAGGRSKEIAAGEIEDRADAAELIVVEPDLREGQRIFLDLEIDTAAAIRLWRQRISDPVIIPRAESAPYHTRQIACGIVMIGLQIHALDKKSLAGVL